jgi:hypothetical protein
MDVFHMFLVSPYIRVDPHVGVGLRQHVHISMGNVVAMWPNVACTMVKRSKAKGESRSANGTFPSMELHGYS